jgi:signal transduction histidine kinase
MTRSGRGPSMARRLRSTLLLVGIVQFLAVAVALLLAVETREDQQRLTGDYFSAIQDSHAGFVRALDVEDAAAAYLRSGDPADLALLRELQQPRPNAVTAAELQRRLQGQREALEKLDALGVSYQDWLAELEPLVAAVETGGRGAVTPAEQRANEDRFAEVRDRYDAYTGGVLVARDDVAERLRLRTSLLFAAVVLSVATAIVAGIVLYAALRTWVIRPISLLAQETRTVRSGALDHEVRIAGPPEVVALGADVEAMRRGLVDQLGELQSAQDRLELQAEELRRSNRDLEQFAYVASHDLQEPLRKVSSFCQMLERRYKGQLDERADQYIAFAVDGAKRMQLLINDLLAFSRVGRITEGMTEVSMDGVLAEATANLATAVEESGAVVTADPLPVVTGERPLLVQLLQNLIGNALKFRGTESPRVRVAARRDGDTWEFAVSDNGIGIEPRYAERIFVIFQRLHAKAEYEGTGIGLSLCKKIVEHHGGSIWLDGDAGAGTTFRWTLPVRQPSVADDTPAAGAVEGDAPDGAEREAAWTATSR